MIPPRINNVISSSEPSLRILSKHGAKTDHSALRLLEKRDIKPASAKRYIEVA